MHLSVVALISSFAVGIGIGIEAVRTTSSLSRPDTDSDPPPPAPSKESHDGINALGRSGKKPFVPRLTFHRRAGESGDNIL